MLNLGHETDVDGVGRAADGIEGKELSVIDALPRGSSLGLPLPSSETEAVSGVPREALVYEVKALPSSWLMRLKLPAHTDF